MMLIKIVNKIKHKNIKVQTLTKIDMDRKVSGLHQGIILDIPDYKYMDLQQILNDDVQFVVILA